MSDPDPVLVEVEDLKQQAAALRERIAGLQKLRSRPIVEPVLVYWRHYRQEYEPYDFLDSETRSPLQAAYGLLEAMSDDGACYAEGVEVGGYFYGVDDLREMFPGA